MQFVVELHLIIYPPLQQLEPPIFGQDLLLLTSAIPQLPQQAIQMKF